MLNVVLLDELPKFVYYLMAMIPNLAYFSPILLAIASYKRFKYNKIIGGILFVLSLLLCCYLVPAGFLTGIFTLYGPSPEGHVEFYPPEALIMRYMVEAVLFCLPLLNCFLAWLIWPKNKNKNNNNHEND